jgi:hypothetical protein
VDEYFGEDGYGYRVCYKILEHILDNMSIALSYEDIIDNITRVKETFDSFKELGKVEYENINNVYNAVNITPSLLRRVLGSGKTEQEAAKAALKQLAKEGFVKPIPQEYLKFCM